MFSDHLDGPEAASNCSKRRTFAHFIPKKSFYKGLAFINDYVNFFIDRVSSLKTSEVDSKGEGYTFLHALSRYTSSKKVMRDQLVGILIAGRGKLQSLETLQHYNDSIRYHRRGIIVSLLRIICSPRNRLQVAPRDSRNHRP